jgi:SAM-dependent methyltransferase
MSQEQSRDTSEYWNFICGSNLAGQLGISGRTSADLEKFDAAYFDFYFYLRNFLEDHLPKSARVLEVGLGYGSVGQWLSRRQCGYVGVDIAQEPVQLLQYRIAEEDNSAAIVGDVISLPFANHTFGASVSIGALHHTGNFEAAIREVVRATKPGGVVVGMVYNLLSGRNFILRPIRSMIYLIENLFAPVQIFGDTVMRSWSDRDDDGSPPASTEYFSRRALRAVLQQHGTVEIRAENLDEISILGSGKKLRKKLLQFGIGRLVGLDLYFVLTLPENSIQTATE